MALTPPEKRLWWNEPLAKAEIIWISVAFLWGLVMFFTMVFWHIQGEQNLSNEAYRINPEVFAAKVEAFTDQYKVRDEGETGIPVVRPPAGSDVYMLGRLWDWWPNESGVFSVVCNEFCGIGHHQMVGRIYVTDK